MKAMEKRKIRGKWLYDLAIHCVAPVVLKNFNAHITEDSIDPKTINGPIIILSNHESVFDYFFTARALYPKYLTFIVAFYFFCLPVQRFFLERVDSIPKMQFCSDIKAMKSMIHAVEDGQNLMLFPEGQLPFYSHRSVLAKGSEKFLKKMQIPVYCINIKGSYLSKPKWAKTNRKGKVEISLFQLFSEDELKQLDEAAIAQRMEDALYHDEYAWQQENKILFKGKKLAEGLENVLPLCAHCGSKHSLKTKGNTITCTSCKTTWTIGEDSIIRSDSTTENIQKWHEFQHRSNEDLCRTADFCLRTNVQIEFTSAKTRKKQFFANGTISMDPQNILVVYEKEAEQQSMKFPICNQPSLPNVAGENFEISTKDGVYTFTPENGKDVFTWVDCCEILYENNRKRA